MKNSSPLARLNPPLVALWVVAVIVLLGGVLLVQTGNAEQAELYTTGSGDYGMLFAAQSSATVGGLLIAVGVLGLLLALVAHAVARSTRQAVVAGVAASVVADDDVLTRDDDEDAADDGFDASVKPDVIEPAVAEPASR